MNLIFFIIISIAVQFVEYSMYERCFVSKKFSSGVWSRRRMSWAVKVVHGMVFVLGMHDKATVDSRSLALGSNTELCPLKPGLLIFIVIALSV